MNRAQRRQKMRKEAEKEKTLNLKKSDISEIKENATKEAIDKAFILMMGIPLLVLKDDWGFGKVRCERFINQVLDMYEAFNNGYLTLDDIHKCLEEESGITIINKEEKSEDNRRLSI